jgi:hypothetical protein
VVAFGTWAVLARGRGPIREQDVAAWVTQRLEPDGGGIRIAAPAGDDESAEEPLIRGIDRPQDAPSPASPNVYAPLRVQEQLVIRELPSSRVPSPGAGRPLRSVVEDVRPGSLFYLEFTTASTPSPGSAVVARFRDGSWGLLADEVEVSPDDRTAYFGPIKMEEGRAEYFVVLADRAGESLLSTVAGTLPRGGGAASDPDGWKSRLAASLGAAGHGWYAIQRIETRPGADNTGP